MVHRTLSLIDHFVTFAYPRPLNCLVGSGIAMLSILSAIGMTVMTSVWKAAGDHPTSLHFCPAPSSFITSPCVFTLKLLIPSYLDLSLLHRPFLFPTAPRSQCRRIHILRFVRPTPPTPTPWPTSAHMAFLARCHSTQRRPPNSLSNLTAPTARLSPTCLKHTAAPHSNLIVRSTHPPRTCMEHISTTCSILLASTARTSPTRTEQTSTTCNSLTARTVHRRRARHQSLHRNVNGYPTTPINCYSLRNLVQRKSKITVLRPKHRHAYPWRTCPRRPSNMIQAQHIMSRELPRATATSVLQRPTLHGTYQPEIPATT